jgi:hypothetical protein
MIYTITFHELSAMLLDFVDHGDGFLYLRLAGAETAVNAIWARLAAKEGRGKKWGSPVTIPLAGQAYPQYVAAQKRVTYRTLRARLPSGLVDLALVHPCLTVAEDNQQGFYLLSYEDGTPSGFFERLNRSLSLPLKPAWADWLWAGGQQAQSFPILETRRVLVDGQPVEKPELVQAHETPISRMDSLGEVVCYTILCHGRYQQAWLHLIRQQLNLGLRLAKTGRGYRAGRWAVYQTPEDWTLHQADQIVARAPSLAYLLAEARQTLGLHFLLEEERE